MTTSVHPCDKQELRLLETEKRLYPEFLSELTQTYLVINNLLYIQTKKTQRRYIEKQIKYGEWAFYTTEFFLYSSIPKISKTPLFRLSSLSLNDSSGFILFRNEKLGSQMLGSRTGIRNLLNVVMGNI